MKKIVLIFILFLIIPITVLAKDTCNSNDIKIKNIKVKTTNGYIEEKEEANITNNAINLNLEMYDLEDSISYDITVKNDSNTDYYFTKNSFNINSDYLEYSVINDSEVIKSGEEKTIKLKVTYKNKIPENNYNENSSMSLTLADEPLSNPETKTTNILLSLIILVGFIYIIVNKKSRIKSYPILLFLLTPLIAFASCTVNLDINTNITINNKEAYFLTGKEVNIKMKELAGDDTSTLTNGYTFNDENITSIKYSNGEPTTYNKEEKNLVSTADSPYPIYMWYEDGTIYWWSEDIHPNLNEDSSYMFYILKKLNNIEGLSEWDVSDTDNMKSMFVDALSLPSLLALKNWNTQSLQNISYLFYNNQNLMSLEGLENWNVSNVTNMSYMCYYNQALSSLKELTTWDTSNVTNMQGMFSETGLTSLEGLERWNTSNVTDTSYMFYNDHNLTSLEELKNWDTSNVNNMHSMFCGNTSLRTLNGLENWDTAKVTKMSYMFRDNSNLTSINELENWKVGSVTTTYGMFLGNSNLTSVKALKNWNTANVTDMSFMFQKNTSLTTLEGLENWCVTNVSKYNNTFSNNPNLNDASAINNWDIQQTAVFSQMFRSTPTHPEFTKIPGTWSAGTFTPAP